ncbi:MAG TPA: DUF2510 domain-containing protein [Acidimicrobiales bacterium]|nr:DUF2510 domain-containing protein [Acidimicrobiales bacterium]
MQQPQAGLQIKTIVSWWFFTVRVFPAKVSIDGSAPIAATWGDTLIPVTPGQHRVSFWWNAYWFLPSNRGEVVVDVPEGQVALLEYKPRWLIFMSGILTWIGVRPMLQQAAPGGAAVASGPASAAGWNADPSGRHELRYWNGSAWTEDVADAGVSSKDPVT